MGNSSGWIDIDGTYGGAKIQWEEDSAPILEWNEGLRFHSGLMGEGDSNIFLNPSREFLYKVQERLKELLPDRYSVFVEQSDWDYEEEGYPHILISVWLTDKPNVEDWEGLDDEQIFDLHWPAIATLFNVTDPGTFNSPYLFAEGF